MTSRSSGDDASILLKGPLTEEASEILRRPTRDLVVIRHVVRDSVFGLDVDGSFEIHLLESQRGAP